LKSDHISQITTSGKPYFVSISGLTMDDNMSMLDKIYESNKTKKIAAIELNLACPNIPGKPMVAYDYDQLDQVLNQICSHPRFEEIPLGVKLAPYFDIPHFHRVADILAKYPIKYIVCVNTIPNALIIDFENECEGIAPKNGLGGLAGGFIKHTALANVRNLFTLLRDRNRSDIDIVGVGGVKNGQDAFELILCGAKAVQVGTCHWTEGSGCFDRIATELESIMQQRGYSTIEDFRGKLKPYTKGNSVKSKSTAIANKSTILQSKSGSGLDSLHLFLMGLLFMLLAVLMKQHLLQK
jgi:dihydroorotate dehydrogenase (fumarate)